ncbi:hypothetical protein C8Q79DRAFT_186163 [Trametes meyenii]|nr:hypothetical protein C8Q79DRAFT_186163 [Trametes meyenii]
MPRRQDFRDLQAAAGRHSRHIPAASPYRVLCPLAAWTLAGLVSSVSLSEPAGRLFSSSRYALVLSLCGASAQLADAVHRPLTAQLNLSRARHARGRRRSRASERITRLARHTGASPRVRMVHRCTSRRGGIRAPRRVRRVWPIGSHGVADAVRNMMGVAQAPGRPEESPANAPAALVCRRYIRFAELGEHGQAHTTLFKSRLVFSLVGYYPQVPAPSSQSWRSRISGPPSRSCSSTSSSVLSMALPPPRVRSVR